VTNDGRTYTFTLRRTFRFSSGDRVTSANFAWSINRALRPEMQSPWAPYFHEIVGADAVLAGQATTARGVTADGDRLVIRLTHAVPDFLHRLTLPALCALPTSLPVDPKGVTAFASAGPYVISSWVRGRSLVLERNPYYRGPRSHRLDRIAYQLGVSLAAERLIVEQGDADYGFFTPDNYVGLPQKYGVNKRRMWIKPGLWIGAIHLNTQSPLFKDNVRLRQAVNYAIDRRALRALAGVFSTRTTDQYLPVAAPGFHDVAIYPSRPDLKRARALAQGHLRSGKAVMYSLCLGAADERAQVVQYDLRQIGVDVEIKCFPNLGVLQAKLGTRGEPFDLGDSATGVPMAYADAYATFKDFDGRDLREVNNTNYSYLNDPAFNRRLDAAARLTGRARERAFGELDVWLARNVAPMAAYANAANPAFFAERVGCVTISPIYWLIMGAVCLRK
jgi:ABC-type transport system substrate-binding protein